MFNLNDLQIQGFFVYAQKIIKVKTSDFTLLKKQKHLKKKFFC